MTPYQQHIQRRNAAGAEWVADNPRPRIIDFPKGTREYSEARKAWHIAYGKLGQAWDAANPAPPKTESELADDEELRTLGRQISGALGGGR
jgi:hypothetical protein